MKTLQSALIIALLLISGIAYAQSGWFQVSDAESGYMMYEVVFPSASTGYALGSNSAVNRAVVLKTTDGGINWQKTFIDGYWLDDIEFVNNNTGYASGAHTINYHDSTYILKTTNGGVNWQVVSSIRNTSLSRIGFCDANTGIMFVSMTGIYKTTNGGLNWSLVKTTSYSATKVLYFDPNNIKTASTGGIMISTNGGTDWLTDSRTVVNYDIFFLNVNTGYSLTRDNSLSVVRKTTDGGINWTYTCTMPQTQLLLKHAYFINENTGFVSGDYYEGGNNGMILKTTNGGVNWGQQFPHNQVTLGLCCINASTGFCGTENGRLFKTTNGGSVFVSNISNEIPDRFELGQNYPNPFNQFSIIDFKLQMKSDVAIKVYDAAGRELQTLVDETLAQGTYRVRFDGSKLCSGIYYYSMTIDGNQTAVRKMIMIK